MRPGNAAGVYLQVIAVAFGIGALVQRSLLAFTMVKLAGAGYLVFLGIEAIRHRRCLAGVLAPDMSSARARRAVWDGFIVGVSNPRSIVFLAAFLPQFTAPGAGRLPLQILILGIVFSLVAWVCTSVWAVAAGTAREWFARSPRRLATIGGTSGLVMIGLGASLAFSGRKN